MTGYLTQWAPTDFSLRKFRRKVESDGLDSGLIAASELLAKNTIGRPVFDRLVDYCIVHTISRAELPKTSSEIYFVNSDSESKTSPLEPPFVAEVGSGYVFPLTGLAVTDQLEIVEESVAPPSQARQFPMAALSRHCFFDDFPVGRSLLCSDNEYVSTAARRLETASPLSPRYPNYYHWMIETVPRIRYLRAYEAQTGNDVTLLIPDDLPSWADETLTLLNWPESKIERSTSSVYHINRLLIPSFPEHFVEDYRWVRRQILDNASTMELPIEPNKNIFISRSNAVERRIVNENEIMEMLSKYNFELVRLEKNTLSQNSKIFNNSDIIVGPHGAGLTDLIFCTDSTVVELFGSKIKPPYERLASVLNVEYTSLKCTPKSTDIVVCPEQLESKIEEIIE
jgi:hypothetical protein